MQMQCLETCNYALPCCLYKVNHKYPNYSFSLNSIPSSEVIHRVLHGQADLGFVVGETDEVRMVKQTVIHGSSRVPVWH